MSRIRHRPEQQTFAFEGISGSSNIFLSVTTVNSAQFSREHYFFESERAVVLLYGNTFAMDNPQKRITAKEIERRFYGRSKHCIDSVDGDFSIVIYEKEPGTIHIFADRWGFRPLYYFNGTDFLVSSEVKPFYEITSALDESFLFLFLNLKRILPGDRTILKDVKKLPPGHYYSNASQGGAMVDYREKYPRIITKQISAVDIDNFLEKYIWVVNNQLNHMAKIGISLSGGLDSRFLLAALDSKQRQKVIAYSYGISNNEDSLLAERVARVAGVKFEFHPLLPGDFLRNAAKAIYLTDGMDLFVQGAAVQAYEKINNRINITLHGVGLEFFYGGWLLENKLMKLGNERELQHYLL